MTSTLIINSSVQQETSTSRMLVKELADALNEGGRLGNTTERDLSKNEMELITSAHVGAYYTPATERTPEQQRVLMLSNTLVDELKQANQLIIGAPMYNFSIPAVLKAWIDLICRVGETFRYTESGPEGLLNIDRAYFVIATGGVPVGSPMDFNSGYLTQIANFIGIKETFVIASDGLNSQREASIAKARKEIALLTSQ